MNLFRNIDLYNNSTSIEKPVNTVVVSVKSMLFMKKRMCTEECLFAKGMVILKGKLYVLALSSLYFLLTCR